MLQSENIKRALAHTQAHSSKVVLFYILHLQIGEEEIIFLDSS